MTLNGEVTRCLPRWLLSLLARRSMGALYALQDRDLANEIYEIHEALDRLGAPGGYELPAAKRIVLLARALGVEGA